MAFSHDGYILSDYQQEDQTGQIFILYDVSNNIKVGYRVYSHHYLNFFI
ncbi:MAG: hypothetical protein WDZ53_02370 [Balneolales bacterium]